MTDKFICLLGKVLTYKNFIYYYIFHFKIKFLSIFFIIESIFLFKVSTRDWRMTFLPAFKKCVEAGAYSMMCSYNG